MAVVHFLLVEFNKGMLAFGPGRRMRWFDHAFDNFGYLFLANVLLLFPWLQPWTGYVALLIGTIAFLFGLYTLSGISVPYVVYGLVIAFCVWQLVGFKRTTRRGSLLD
jgi:hypothetical protein